MYRTACRTVPQLSMGMRACQTLAVYERICIECRANWLLGYEA